VSNQKLLETRNITAVLTTDKKIKKITITGAQSTKKSFGVDK